MLQILPKEKNEKNTLTLWIIWVAMIGSLLVYVIMCHLIGDQIRRNINPDLHVEKIRRILYLVAAVTLFVAYQLRKFMLSDRSRRLGIIPTGSFIKASKQTPQMARYTVAMIVSLALSESIGIYGLLLFFLGDDFNTLYTFIGVSGFAMFFFRPKGYEIEMLALTNTTEDGASQDQQSQ